MLSGTKEELTRLYHEEKMSIPEIAILLEVNNSTLWCRFKRLGIPRRSYVEMMKLRVIKGTNYAFPKGNQFGKNNGFKKGNKAGKANKGRVCTWRKKISRGVKKLWEDPDYRKRNIVATLKGLHKRPTNLEKELIEIIENHNLPFEYVGDGSFLIGFKNPDFISKTDMKVCVEVAYGYYKRKVYGSREEYEEQRSAHFSKYGWRTIFLWGDRRLELSEKQIIKLLKTF